MINSAFLLWFLISRR